MKNRTLAAVGVFVVTLMLSLSADPALAQGKGPDKVKPAKQAKQVKPAKPVKDVKYDKPVKQEKPAKPAIFGSHDRDLITRYYSQNSGLPPGLAKRDGNLPPGLERQLQRNGTLPPGLRAKLRPFPAALERQLEPLPYGYRRGILDRHLVVYRTGTYVIGDSIFNVLR